MTKETKIGLLVGLAFIILFAIILSEKGSESRDSTPPSFAVADAAKDDSSLRSDDRPLSGVGRLPIRERLAQNPTATPTATDTPRDTTAIASNTNDSRSAPLGRPIPSEDEELPPLPRSFVDLMNQSLLDDGPNQPAEVVAQDTATISIEDAVAGAINPQNAEPVGKPVDANQQPLIPIETRSTQTDTHKLAQAIPAARAAEANAPQPAETRATDRGTQTTSPATQVPIVILAKHEVQPGESLGKIAAKYYGRSTPERIEAIYLANRDVLSDINKVNAKDELRIPKLGTGPNGSFEAAPEFAGTQVVQAAQTPQRGEQPINRPNQVRIPLPIGDQTRPTGTQRNDQPDRRAVSQAEQPTRTVSNHDADKAFTWYEVKERDTLSRIARRLLGSERRYIEIYQLNRDRLPNMNALKPGQKIRIPVRSTHADNDGEVMSASAITLDRF